MISKLSQAELKSKAKEA